MFADDASSTNDFNNQPVVNTNTNGAKEVNENHLENEVKNDRQEDQEMKVKATPTVSIAKIEREEMIEKEKENSKIQQGQNQK